MENAIEGFIAAAGALVLTALILGVDKIVYEIWRRNEQRKHRKQYEQQTRKQKWKK